MRFTTLLLTVLTFTLGSAASAATVSFSSGGSFTLFQVASGDPLANGFLHAGYYETSPIGLSSADLQANFNPWASFGSDSGTSGFFGNGNFPTTDVGSAAGRPLYLVVTDTNDVNSATQIAVFTNSSDTNWNFPATELGFAPSVSLDAIIGDAPGSSVLAGAITTSPLTMGGPAIQLAAVPEPSVAILGLLSLCGLLRRCRS